MISVCCQDERLLELRVKYSYFNFVVTCIYEDIYFNVCLFLFQYFDDTFPTAKEQKDTLK